MSALCWVGQLLLTIAVAITTPITTLLILPLAKQNGYNIFPPWLQWFNTYDDTGENQGLYETQVYSWFTLPTTFGQWLLSVLPSWFPRPSTPKISLLQTIGWYLKTWYWLGIRNQMYGLFYTLAPHVTEKVIATETSAWKVLRLDQDGKHYFCFLSKRCDVGWGWKLFNSDKPTFYLRLRPWKKPSN